MKSATRLRRNRSLIDEICALMCIIYAGQRTMVVGYHYNIDLIMSWRVGVKCNESHIVCILAYTFQQFKKVMQPLNFNILTCSLKTSLKFSGNDLIHVYLIRLSDIIV